MNKGLSLYVAPLDKKIDDVFLKQEFEKFGDILRVYVVKDESGFSKGYGFVHFRSTTDGQKAMMEMDEKSFFGRPIRVRMAKDKKGTRYDGGDSTNWVIEWTISPTEIQATDDNISDACYPAKVEPRKRYDRGNSTNWVSEWTISPTEIQTTDDKISNTCYPVEVEPSNTEVSNIKQFMRKLLEEQLYTDITFISKLDRKSSISAHKAVVAVRSPIFAEILFDDHEDTTGKKMEFLISHIAFDTFRSIIKYLYTDEILSESDSQVQDILLGAKKFEIQSLVDQCNSYFQNQELTEQNVCSKLEASIDNKIEVLKDRCTKYIQENTLQVINSSDFLKCSHSAVQEICELQSFNLRSEAELLDGVGKWLRNRPFDDRKLMEPVLKCIRFLNFTVAEFGHVLKRYPNLLTAEDGLQIMLYLSIKLETPDLRCLPSWCNQNTLNRCKIVEKPCDPRMELFQVQLGQAGVGAARPASMTAANVNQSRPAAYKYTSNMRNPPQPQTAYKYTSNMRNPPQRQTVQQAVTQQAVHIQGQKPLPASMLANANAQEQRQKQMLGERMFPVIHRWYPDLAGKITGMLLGIDNSELLHMLDHQESLKAKVEEAVAVLQAHHAKETLSRGLKKEG